MSHKCPKLLLCHCQVTPIYFGAFFKQQEYQGGDLLKYYQSITECFFPSDVIKSNT